MRRPLVAGAILATILTMPLAVGALAVTPATVMTNSQRATAALEYLLVAQKANGSLDNSIGETADLVIGAAAAGYDPATLHGCSGGTGALSFLATASDGAATDAARTGKAILAVAAAGGNPAAFSGRDLMARLAALYHSDTGAYGDGSTMGQAYAILAVVASGGSVATAATDKLVALQGTDGSWSYGSTPPAAGDGDSNSTAVVLMALDAAGVHTADATGLAYLHTQQMTDGGFAYQNPSPWGPAASDADSDAEVLQALIAAGQDPEAGSWLQGSSNVLTHLRSAQGADGGFAYQTYGESALTTSMIPAALMRVPYAGAVHPTAGLSVPTTSCPTPSPSPSLATPSPTPTPTPPPAVQPTDRPVAVATAESTPAPTDATSPSPTSTESPSPAPTPASSVGGVTAAPRTPDAGTGGAAPGSSSGPPALLVYLFAGVAGAGIVAGGWLLHLRMGKP